MPGADGDGGFPPGFWVEAAWWKRRQRRQLAAYCAIGAGFVGLIAVINAQDDSQTRARCEERQDGRTALRAVITRSFESGGTFDLTVIPTFNEIDDPDVRETLQILVNRASGPDREQTRDTLLSLAPPIDC